MAASTGIQIILECPICSEDDNVPKNLQCGHTICETCVHIMAVYTNGKATAVNCPMCRKDTDIPTHGLPNNYSLIQLREVLNPSPKENSCQMCHEQRRNKTEQFCKTCEVYMCGKCVEDHQQKICFQNHCLAPLNVLMCQSHKEQVKDFCTFCNRLLCLFCIQDGDCEGHVEHIKKITDLVERTESDVQIVQETITEYIADNERWYQSAIPKLMGQLEQIKEDEHKVNLQAEQMIEKVRENHTKFWSYLQERKDIIEKSIAKVQSKRKQHSLERLKKATGVVEGMFINHFEFSIHDCPLTWFELKTKQLKLLCPYQNISWNYKKVLPHVLVQRQGYVGSWIWSLAHAEENYFPYEIL